MDGAGEEAVWAAKCLLEIEIGESKKSCSGCDRILEGRERRYSAIYGYSRK